MFLVFGEGIFFKTAAFLTFLAAGLTDYWDGALARNQNQITAFGRLMDPIADKILALAAFLAFVQMGIVPAWMVAVILARDLLVTGMRFLMPSQGDVQAARKSGKHKTALQFLMIIAILIFLILRETFFWNASWNSEAFEWIYWGMFATVAVTVWSGVVYVFKNRELFR
jgi:CDP-diacylglycerol--glycerol-3-phosphate 3-phosphatidyltransferase